MNRRTRICVPVCAKSLGQLESDLNSAAVAGDLIEIRLDCLEDPESQFPRVLEITRNLRCPMILTLRPAEQGGHFGLSFSQRREFWHRFSYPTAGGFADIE